MFNLNWHRLQKKETLGPFGGRHLIKQKIGEWVGKGGNSPRQIIRKWFENKSGHIVL